jgi:hypothetical protein
MAPMDPAADAATLADVLRLAAEVKPAWDDLSAAIPSWHPRNKGEEGEEGEEEGGEGEGEGDAAAAAAEAAAKGAEKEGTEGAGKPATDDKTDWKAMARKHEREAKKARAEAETHKTKLAEIEASNLSDQEKAIAKAREEARAEALTEAGTERRTDKIESAVTKIAAIKGVTVGEGDAAKTVKFSDPDDVQMWLERQIAKGDIDGDDIYKDGKVDDAALTDALTELAASKPGWLVGASAGATNGKPAGSADAGKGGANKGLDSMSVEEHIKRKSIPSR